MSTPAVALRGRARVPHRRLAPLATLAVVLFGVALLAVLRGFGAVPDTLRALVPGVLLFAACGYGPARLLVPAALEEHTPLLVLPVGAMCATLALTVVGLLHVPFAVSLPLVAVAGLACSLAVHRRLGPGRAMARPALRAAALPFALAALIAATALLPVFRAGYVTVLGENGDAILAVGTANFLRHAPPTAVRPELGLDRVPILWRSKLPIYYGLAAVSVLAGESTITAFAPMAALMLALTGLGLFVVGRALLRAPPPVALAAAGLGGISRIAIHAADHPFYNQLWGLFTLPFTVLAGWAFLTRPTRRGLVLLALWITLALFAYPLILPYPAAFLGAMALTVWRREASARPPRRPGWIRALRLPDIRRPWLAVPLVLLAIPVLAVAGRGVWEKGRSSLDVLLPGSNLSGWSGSALGYDPLANFLGLSAPRLVGFLGALVVIGLAFLGARRARPEARPALSAILAGGLLIAAYFRARHGGQLFYLKALSFLGPVAVALAVAEVGMRMRGVRGRRPVALGAVLLGALLLAGSVREVYDTYPYATRDVQQLPAWDRALPPGAAVRIDVPPDGFQLWAWYEMPLHPVCASQPLGGFFPHPVHSLHADYALVDRRQRRPPDAVGPPVRRNGLFALYRLDERAIPGPTLCSRRLVWDFTRVSY